MLQSPIRPVRRLHRIFRQAPPPPVLWCLTPVRLAHRQRKSRPVMSGRPPRVLRQAVQALATSTPTLLALRPVLRQAVAYRMQVLPRPLRLRLQISPLPHLLRQTYLMPLAAIPPVARVQEMLAIRMVPIARAALAARTRVVPVQIPEMLAAALLTLVLRAVHRQVIALN